MSSMTKTCTVWLSALVVAGSALLQVPAVAATATLAQTAATTSATAQAPAPSISPTRATAPAQRATAIVTVRATTQRMSGGSLNSRLLGTLPAGYRTTAGCQIIGQAHRGFYGPSNLWWDTPVGWLPDADVLGSVAVPKCGTRRAIGVRESRNTAPYGQCTWKAKDAFHNAVGAWPALYGNARDWLSSARAAGYTTVLDAPLDAKAIVVFQPGVQGAGSVGHVAWVLTTQQRSDGRWIKVVEHNYNSTGAVNHERWVKDVVGMSYVLAI